jgi:hypothetical protein
MVFTKDPFSIQSHTDTVPAMKTLLTFACFLTACGADGPPEDALRTQSSPVDQQVSGVPVDIGHAEQLSLKGFPCEVRAVLQTNCAGCHAGNLYVETFTSRADFLADMGDGTTFGQRAVTRLNSSDRPMPPYGAERVPSVDDRATISAWVESGMPAGACGDLTRP